MSDYYTQFIAWAVSMGEYHAVNPLLLGSLYLCSKLSLFSFLAWVIRNMRQKKPFMFQLLFACLSFTVPYLYLVIAGRNIAVWVYVVIGAIFAFGAYSIWKKVAVREVVEC